MAGQCSTSWPFWDPHLCSPTGCTAEPGWTVWPMSTLIDAKVLRGLAAAWSLASWPTRVLPCKFASKIRL